MRAPLLLALVLACDASPLVEIPSASDGAVGVHPDAGAASDATAPDALLDSTSPDADPIDASAPDAEPVDAVAPDADPIDAGAASLLEGLALGLYANLGDSVGAGYNAARGRGYAPLLFRNHTDYPAWAQDHLSARFPSARYEDRAASGATSGDLEAQARRLGGSTGDTLVTIYVGGNDFNDDIRTMLSATLTQAAATRWASNLRATLGVLRARTTGRLLVVVATIHDVTDGTGEIPPQFTRGFCGTIRDPRFIDAFRQRALTNLASFNEVIRRTATDEGLVLVDSHALFQGHGMGSADRWIDDDCAHFTDRGHHEFRRAIWALLD